MPPSAAGAAVAEPNAPGAGGGPSRDEVSQFPVGCKVPCAVSWCSGLLSPAGVDVALAVK